MTNRGNENLFDVKYKVLLLGDTLVGKTSLQRFIAGKDFRTDIGATIGIYNEIDFFFVERSYDIFLQVLILLIKLFLLNNQRLIYKYGKRDALFVLLKDNIEFCSFDYTDKSSK
jgi:GTPase SAR1 family protein